MKPEEKDLKQGAELNEEELDGVTGGHGAIYTAANTMQFQQGMEMGANTLQYQPGVDPAQAQTLEQRMHGANQANAKSAPKNPGGAHSV